MGDPIFEKRTAMPVTAEELCAWQTRPGAFERLTPPWQPIPPSTVTGTIADGGQHRFRLPFGPFGWTWVAQYSDYQPGRQFRDTQIRGPFARWEHTHRFEPLAGGGSELIDRIEYRLPGGLVGQWLMGGAIRRAVEQAFAFRHEVTAADLARHAAARRQPMHVVITGASGLVGTALSALLTTAGHKVSALSREPADPMRQQLHWDPEKKDLDKACFNGVDAVVHLAGDNIGEGRWSTAKKQRIRDSRILGTTLLADTLSKLQRPPQTLISASAIGYYGNRDETEVDETASPGSDFLAGLCQEWEQATEPALQKGIRVVHPRFGVILSPRGGALRKMLTPFKLGAGGRIGSGRQYMSWISLDDAIGAIVHLIEQTAIRGPVNVVAPNPVTNREFTKTLGRVLGRPTIFPLPAFMVRLLFGEMGQALLLNGQRVKPAVLSEWRYSFRHPDLETALRYLLGR